MRVMTVRQPFAWAIIHGGKDVENRSRNVAGDYRGAVAIHAGLTDAVTDYDIDESALSVLRAWREWWRRTGEPGGQRGHIIGVVDLVSVHHAETCFGNPSGPCSPWSQPGALHIVLANPEPLPEPIPARGRLGLWRPDADLLAAITEQVTL